MEDFFEEMIKMHEEMDRMFERLWGRRLLESKGSEASKNIAKSRLPISNVYETEKNVIASVELPGVDKENIELNVTNHYIEVRVQEKAEREEKKEGQYLHETRSRAFYRRLPLPCKVEIDKADARYKNGVLRIEIPKAGNGDGRKRIEIK